MYDVLIIGLGVIGSSILRELSKYKLQIIAVDKENDVSNGTSKANSGIIHAGYDAPYDTLKGKLNARGNFLYDKMCEELNVELKRIGSLVLAFDEGDIEELNRLYENGQKLNIPKLKIIDRDEILEIEPNINKNVLKALYAPTAGIIDPWELAIAATENAMDNGAEVKLNFEVESIEKIDGHFLIKSKDGDEIKSKIVINAAGVYGDKIHSMIGKPDFEINPTRGQYYVLDQNASGLVNHVIFPCPSEKGKGVLIVPTVANNILIGPNSEHLEHEDREETNTSIDGLEEVKKEAQKLCEKIPFDMNIRTFSGLRAESTRGDFIIEESEIKNFINVTGIKSPGLSSVPAISEMLEGILKEMIDLEEKEDFNPIRRERIRFKELPIEEKQKLLKEDSRYGKIVCRCELVSEKEIIDSIERNAGSTSVNGVKRRTRAGAGRCQGGFCSPIVVEILKRELDIDESEVLLENKGSNIIKGYTKDE